LPSGELRSVRVVPLIAIKRPQRLLLSVYRMGGSRLCKLIYMTLKAISILDFACALQIYFHSESRKTVKISPKNIFITHSKQNSYLSLLFFPINSI
jgi:hypothetical protein